MVRVFDKQSIFERNALGQNPLHLSCAWPPGIAYLLERDDACVMINAPDEKGILPLIYAYGIGCYDAVKLLLEAGSPLDLPRISAPDDTWGRSRIYDDVDRDRIWELVTDAVGDRRRRLQVLARENLPQDRIDQLLSDKRLLDARAIDVVAALIELGVSIPSSLQVPCIRTTVYHTQTLTANLAERFFLQGFRDVDSLDHSGMTPLMLHTKRRVQYDSFQDTLTLLWWFKYMGADLSLEVPGWPQRWTVAYRLCSSLGHAWRYGSKTCRDFIQGKDQQRILEVLANTNRDACRCACSSGGCLPVTSILKGPNIQDSRSEAEWLYGIKQGKSRHSDSYSDFSWSEFGWVLQSLTATHPVDDDEWTWLFLALCRCSTFVALGLRHTCDCYQVEYDAGPYVRRLSPDEIDEIQSEERYLIDRLESLLTEFEAKYIELKITALEFFEGYWSTRINKVMQEMDQPMDEEKLDRIREIGVVIES